MHNIDGPKTTRINFGKRREEEALVLIPTPQTAQRADKKEGDENHEDRKLIFGRLAFDRLLGSG
jgi:hypothetical protein